MSVLSWAGSAGYDAPVQALGRLLQLFGLVLVPMALIYYFANQGRVSEDQLASLSHGELILLAAGAGVFLLGILLARK